MTRDEGLGEGGSSSKREEKAEGDQYLDKPCKVRMWGGTNEIEESVLDLSLNSSSAVIIVLCAQLLQSCPTL